MDFIKRPNLVKGFASNITQADYLPVKFGTQIVTKDLMEIANTNFENGLESLDRALELQDLNTVLFYYGQLTKYLFERGVAEFSGYQDYPAGSIVTYDNALWIATKDIEASLPKSKQKQTKGKTKDVSLVCGDCDTPSRETGWSKFITGITYDSDKKQLKEYLLALSKFIFKAINELRENKGLSVNTDDIDLIEAMLASLDSTVDETKKITDIVQSFIDELKKDTETNSVAIKTGKGLEGDGTTNGVLQVALGNGLIFESNKIALDPSIEKLENIKTHQYRWGIHTFRTRTGEVIGLPVKSQWGNATAEMSTEYMTGTEEYLNGFYFCSYSYLTLFVTIDNTLWFINNNAGVISNNSSPKSTSWSEWRKLTGVANTSSSAAVVGSDSTLSNLQQAVTQLQSHMETYADNYEKLNTSFGNRHQTVLDSINELTQTLNTKTKALEAKDTQIENSISTMSTGSGTDTTELQNSINTAKTELGNKYDELEQSFDREKQHLKETIEALQEKVKTLESAKDVKSETETSLLPVEDINSYIRTTYPGYTTQQTTAHFYNPNDNKYTAIQSLSSILKNQSKTVSLPNCQIKYLLSNREVLTLDNFKSKYASSVNTPVSSLPSYSLPGNSFLVGDLVVEFKFPKSEFNSDQTLKTKFLTEEYLTNTFLKDNFEKYPVLAWLNSKTQYKSLIGYQSITKTFDEDTDNVYLNVAYEKYVEFCTNNTYPIGSSSNTYPQSKTIQFSSMFYKNYQSPPFAITDKEEKKDEKLNVPVITRTTYYTNATSTGGGSSG